VWVTGVVDKVLFFFRTHPTIEVTGKYVIVLTMGVLWGVRGAKGAGIGNARRYWARTSNIFFLSFLAFQRASPPMGANWKENSEICLCVTFFAMPLDGSQSLNQGHFGTCVAHAFAQALIRGLWWKYNIPCDASTFVTTVKARCPCWNGHRTEQMPRDWNVKHAEEGAAIENVDKTCRYNVRVEFREIHSFEEARCEMQRAEILGMYMPCTITTSADGHNRHSVALTQCYKGTDEMCAVNRWGAKELHLDVTRQNFKLAITFDTIITAATGGNGLSMPVPQLSKIYTDALHS